MEQQAGAALSARGIAHRYGEDGHAVHVLAGLDLELEAGAYVAIMGPSGSGKTTLLRLLGGLEKLQAGELEVGGAELSELSGDGLADYRRRTVGFVFQDYGLLDLLNARENVELALTLAGLPRDERRARAEVLLRSVGLGERSEHQPVALSGGERQRVAVARALANHPRLLLADEPTGNLDAASAVLVMDLLDEVQRDHGCTMVVVTHNPAVAERAGRRLRLFGGRLAAL